VLTKDAAADQRPHQSAEIVGLSADAARQISEWQWPFRERISDAKLGGRLDGLRHPSPEYQLYQCSRCRNQPLIYPIQAMAKTLDGSRKFGRWNFGIGE